VFLRVTLWLKKISREDKYEIKNCEMVTVICFSNCSVGGVGQLFLEKSQIRPGGLSERRYIKRRGIGIDGQSRGVLL
jgi:hypothetical protein